MPKNIRRRSILLALGARGRRLVRLGGKFNKSKASLP